MQFAHVAAQKQLKNKLAEMVDNNRLAHGLLFSGDDGGSQLPLALALAQYFFCENKTADDSCGVCPSCLKVSRLIHPDVFMVFPIYLSKDTRHSDDLVKEFREKFLEFPYMNLNDWFNTIDADNKQPVIGKDESVEILRKLSYTSYEGRGKIMIIWMPEKMNNDSANKLLKILEEPPDETFFFLVTSAYDQLMATIISRTQLVKVNAASEGELANVISAAYNTPLGHAQQIVNLAQHNAREAFLLASEHESSNDNFLLFRDLMRNSLRFDPVKISGWIDEFHRLGREKQKQFFIYCLSIFRNCILMKHVQQMVFGTDEEKEFLQKFHPYIHMQNHESLADEYNKAFYHIERNVSPKILAMDLALKTNELLNKK